ncbi:MAG: hypothetical protein NZ771_09685 [Candidatus Marinimicrobia bacterium]|nr:hypothetical protein [Candidatus Neomarinimicrobiota bacterium]
MIDPKFWADDKMMSLTTRHRLLFIGIWNFSDDGGIHKNSNNMLKAEVFPCDDIIVEEVGKLKDELIELELIIPFNSNGIELFYVKNWKIYQSIQKPIPSKYKLPDDYSSPTVALQPNRIEQNRIEEKRKSSLSKEELSEFQKKYPGIDVNQSYNKFILNKKEKGRVFEDLVAAFEKWLIRDVERGWNPRDKSNDLVTIYCPGCDDKKEVKRGTKEERSTICCGEPMLGFNFYLIEKNTRKNNKVE